MGSQHQHPSGHRRWHSPQPNVSGVGLVASYSARFWGTLVVIGVIAGLAAGALVELLRLVERVTFGAPHTTSLLAAVEHASDLRRIVALLLAAAIVVAGLWLLGRASTGGIEVTEAIWLHSGRLPLISSTMRGLISIVTVGMGVSLGREGAPQLVGAAAASQISDLNGFPVWQRRLLVACGAGAGFAAVYNVPLGGTLLAVEVMLGTLALPLVLPALLTSLTATATAWTILGTGPTYRMAAPVFHPTQLLYAALAGPIIGLVAVGWTRLVTASNRLKPSGIGRRVAPFAAFALLGLLSFEYPQLTGNGHGIVQLGVVGGLSLGVLVALLFLKPLVTAACIASGAPGGLFTPSFAVGVLLAAVLGSLWSHIWPGSAPGSFAVIGGGAFLAAAMQGPLSGIVLVLELTRHLETLMVPTLVAVVEATVVARRLGAASIYSARMASGEVVEEGPTVYAAAVEALKLQTGEPDDGADAGTLPD